MVEKKVKRPKNGPSGLHSCYSSTTNPHWMNLISVETQIRPNKAYKSFSTAFHTFWTFSIPFCLSSPWSSKLTAELIFVSCLEITMTATFNRCHRKSINTHRSLQKAATNMVILLYSLNTDDGRGGLKVYWEWKWEWQPDCLSRFGMEISAVYWDVAQGNWIWQTRARTKNLR